jgi:capsular exopolysaccharide synthesis family protein
MVYTQPNKDSRLVFVTEPCGLAVEQYKLLRRRLCALHPGGGILMISSPGPGEGKTLTAVNLAWCLADGGSATVIVDLDFREPAVASTLRHCFESGVEDVLAGSRTLSESLYKLGDRPLHVLGITKALDSMSVHLTSSSLTSLFADLSARFSWIIVDVPPVLPLADVAELIPHVDGAILVVRARKTAQPVIAPALEILGTKLWGVILNDAPIIGDSYGYGAYKGRYGKR